MPFVIVRDDISRMQADALICPTSREPGIGGGVETAIHQKAGPELLKARQTLGKLATGCAGITDAYGLDAKFVIHGVGPVWRGGLFGESGALRRCYRACLGLALEHKCESVVLPLMGAGSLGFPGDKALEAVLAVCSEFLSVHEMQITLAVFDRSSFKLSEKLFRSVQSFADENYVQARLDLEYRDRQTRFLGGAAAFTKAKVCQEDFMPPPCAAAPAPCAQPTLQELLDRTDAGFTETLLKLIDRTGKKDSQIYTRANLSRQHFSKIRNNPDYKPTKATALALAIALELDLEGTRDLIGRAGFALTHSSKADVIVMYFIQNRIYDLFRINATLFEFDQNLLGA